MKVAILVAEGFEEIEVTTVYDVLKRAGADVVTIGLDTKEATGAHGLKIVTDDVLANIRAANLDALVIPGGHPGYVNLSESKAVLELTRMMAGAGKYLASICAGPLVLEKAGVIKGKTVACFPGMEGELPSALFSPDRVAEDGNIITSRGPGTAMDFALKLVERWLNPDVAMKLRKEMVIN